MRRPTARTTRLLPDGTPLQNRLLAALPAHHYRRLTAHLRMTKVKSGETLQQHGARIPRVCFRGDPNMFRERQPIPGEPIEPPTKCPECNSPRVTTTSKTITASTYWRCEACGEIWNAGRRQPTYRYSH